MFIERSCSQDGFYSKEGIYHWIKAESCWTRDQSASACFSSVCHVALVSSIHRFSLLDCLRLRFAAAVSDKMLCYAWENSPCFAVQFSSPTRQKKIQRRHPICWVVQCRNINLYLCYFDLQFFLKIFLALPDFLKNQDWRSGEAKDVNSLIIYKCPLIFACVTNSTFLKNVPIVLFQIMKSKAQ